MWSLVKIYGTQILCTSDMGRPRSSSDVLIDHTAVYDYLDEKVWQSGNQGDFTNAKLGHHRAACLRKMWTAQGEKVNTQSANRSKGVMCCVLQIKCELGLTEQQESVLTLLNFAGMVLGSFAWGALADMAGRKLAFFSICVFGVASSLLAAVMPNLSVGWKHRSHRHHKVMKVNKE